MTARHWTFAVFAFVLALNAAADPKIDFAEQNRHILGDAQLTRTLVVTNLTTITTTYGIEWYWVARSGGTDAMIDKGHIRLGPVKPGESGSHPFRLQVPPVKRPTELFFVMQGGPDIHAHFFRHKAYPAISGLTWKFLDGKSVGVHGAHARFKDFLTSYGATVRSIDNPADAADFKGDLLVISPAADESADWIRFLSRWRNNAPADGPRMPLIMFPAADPTTSVTKARVTALGHELFQDLNDYDLSDWLPQGVVASNRLPLPPGAFRRLAATTDHGTTNSLLIELVNPAGSRGYLCAFPVDQRFHAEPAAEILLNNMLRLALETKSPPRTGVVSLIDPGAESKPLIDQAIFGGEMPARQPDRMTSASVMIIDAEHPFPPKVLPIVKNFVAGGGHAIVMNMAQSSDLRDWAIGQDLDTFDSADLATTVTMVDTTDRLLRGTTVYDWQTLFPQRSDLHLPSLTLFDTESLIEPGLVVVRKIGTGRLILIQLDPAKMTVEQLRLIFGQILANLGVRVATHETDHES
ncbi:hypothetical protein LLG95_09790 [bacterium]|nr:hypothetical protein [bacterium]